MTLLSRGLAFLITAALGTAVHWLVVGSRSPSGQSDLDALAITAPVKIDFVPSMDLTELTNHSTGIVGTTIELNALFDVDGQVKEVEPTQTAPKVISEASTQLGKTIENDFQKADRQFVKQLTVSLLAVAVAEVRSIRFSPRVSEGRPLPDRILAVLKFNFAMLPAGAQGTRCDNARLTITNDGGVLWDRSVWVNGCIVN